METIDLKPNWNNPNLREAVVTGSLNGIIKYANKGLKLVGEDSYRTMTALKEIELLVKDAIIVQQYELTGAPK